MNFDHMRDALQRYLDSRDERIDAQVQQRLVEMAEQERIRQVEEMRRQWPQRYAPYYFVPQPPTPLTTPDSQPLSVRRLFRQPSEPLVTTETAEWLQAWYAR